MSDEQRFSWEGIHIIWIILGLLGAALGVGSMPEMSRKQLLTALGAGFICAILGPWLIPEVIAAYRGKDAIPLPLPVSSTLAFFFGIGGMFIVLGAIVFWSTVRTNPLALIEWLRGKGPPPPPPPSPGDTTHVKP